MSAPPPPPGVLVGTSAGYLRLAAFTMFLYDYVLTFGDEVEYIWKARRTLAKWLFLLTRYVTFCFILIDTFFVIATGMTNACSWYPNISAAGLVFSVLVVQVILQLRIYVLFDRQRWMLYTNIGLSVLELAVTVFILAREFPKSKMLPSPDWVIGSCYSWHPPSLAAGFAAPLAFETYLAALAIYNLRRGAKLRFRATDIMSVLVRDSVVYAVFIAAVMALNVVLIALYPVRRPFSPYSYHRSFLTFFLAVTLTQALPGYASIGLVDAAGAIGGTRLLISMLSTTSQSEYARDRHRAEFSMGDDSRATTATVQFGENTVRSRWRLTFLEALLPRTTTMGTVSVRLHDRDGDV